jgi:TatD DNase family protein
MQLIDSHCHLNYPQFIDLDDVIIRAENAGVKLMQTISTKRDDFEIIKQIAEKYPQIYCSIGIHPHEAEAHKDVTETELSAAANHPKVIGIGETGLDFYYEHSPRELQIELFKRHINVARKLDLPVIVHSRNADAETVALLQEMYAQAPFKILIHCFSTSKYLADKVIEIGGYISISGIITFKKSQELRDIVAQLPLDRLLVETDAPYLAPEPHRGQPCEPAHTRYTAEKLAQIQNISLEQCAEATTANFYRLFSKVNPLKN